ncbi:hypothetical protein EVAR_12814_1 [Eumeta japonica]|uniref:Uncharacterized protein n=1 Tax=Eumeta variegata TaxID=151549 RepID=A0A4C1UAR7_EUMVA|nr:hypothetical protein EVAR_12814_1 [Eumeta japonica]
MLSLPVERLAILKKTAGMVKRIIMDNKAFKEDTSRAKISEVYTGVAAEVDSTEVAAEAEVIPEVKHRTTFHPSHAQLKEKGIELLPCPPNVHELNGVSERYKRSAMDIETKQTSNVSSEIVKTEYENDENFVDTKEYSTGNDLKHVVNDDNLNATDKDVDVESPKRKRCPPSRYGIESNMEPGSISGAGPKSGSKSRQEQNRYRNHGRDKHGSVISRHTRYRNLLYVHADRVTSVNYLPKNIVKAKA